MVHLIWCTSHDSTAGWLTTRKNAARLGEQEQWASTLICTSGSAPAQLATGCTGLGWLLEYTGPKASWKDGMIAHLSSLEASSLMKVESVGAMKATNLRGFPSASSALYDFTRQCSAQQMRLLMVAGQKRSLAVVNVCS